ncbi:MAG: hypothetical protein QMD92_08515 [bacterium]|nr:hypothetical protein [bacterium]
MTRLLGDCDESVFSTPLKTGLMLIEEMTNEYSLTSDMEEILKNWLDAD